MVKTKQTRYFQALQLKNKPTYYKAKKLKTSTHLHEKKNSKTKQKAVEIAQLGKSVVRARAGPKRNRTRNILKKKTHCECENNRDETYHAKDATQQRKTTHKILL